MLNKIFRVVVRDYLNDEFLLRSMTEDKPRSDNRRDHLRVRRFLLRTLEGGIPLPPPKDGASYSLRKK